MATSDWAIPTGKAITGATYIKDTDDNIAATIEDLVDWCNNANGTYNDWTLTGLRTDFVDVNTAQTITAVKTVDTLGAIDFTGGELRVGGTAVTSTAAELNLLDGATVTTAELNVLDGYLGSVTELNYLKDLYDTGVTSTEFDKLDGLTASTSDLNRTTNLTDGTYTPTTSALSNIASVTAGVSIWSRNNDTITVSGSFTVSLTATGSGSFNFTIPISKTGGSNINGSGVADDADSDARIVFANNLNASFRVNSSSTSSRTYGYMYQYNLAT